MCGLAGFAGIAEESTRVTLTLVLGIGIDKRGGHGIGYATIEGDEVRLGRDMADWLTTEPKTVLDASKGILTMLHSRYATCGKHTIDETHPFEIARSGKTILYGMHNGMIDTAVESSRKNGRKFTVDSLELLELLADNRFDEISALEGYGTLVWVRADDPKTVRMVRMTESAELYVCKLVGGGFVYGSTDTIVENAVKAADLKHECFYKLNKGQVYGLRENAFVVLTGETVTLSSRTHKKMSASWMLNDEWEDLTLFTTGDRRPDGEETFSDWYKRQEMKDRAFFDRTDVEDRDSGEYLLDYEDEEDLTEEDLEKELDSLWDELLNTKEDAYGNEIMSQIDALEEALKRKQIKCS